MNWSSGCVGCAQLHQLRWLRQLRHLRSIYCSLGSWGPILPIVLRIRALAALAARSCTSCAQLRFRQRSCVSANAAKQTVTPAGGGGGGGAISWLMMYHNRGWVRCFSTTYSSNRKCIVSCLHQYLTFSVKTARSEYRVLHTLDVTADNSLTGDFRLARPHWNNMARLICNAKFHNPLQMYGWVICFEINCTWEQMSHRVMFGYRCWSEI